MIEMGIQAFESGSELAKALMQDMARVLSGKGKSKRTAEVFENIVVRSLTKTGSTLRKKAYTSFSKNELGLEPLRRHPLNQANIKMTLRKNKPGQRRKPRLDMREGSLGGRLPQMLRFRVDEADKNVVMGIVESTGRNAIASTTVKEWREKFKKWQEGGPVEYQHYFSQNPSKLRSMYAYFNAIGIPITRPPIRPRREVMTKIESVHNPAEMFQRFFEERVRR